MTLYAEIHVSGPGLLLNRTIRAVPDVVVRILPQPFTDREEPMVFYRALDGDFEGFEAALTDDPSVSEWAVTEDWDAVRIYRVGVSPETTLLTPAFSKLDVQVLRAESGEGGWHLALRLPDREALAGVSEICDDAGVGLRVDRLSPVFGPADGGIPGLTDDQRELLLQAHRGGYFDVPREVSQAELAAALGVSESAVSTHLRRAMGRLVEATLVGTEPPTDGDDT